jgi:hypothetical protein
MLSESKLELDQLGLNLNLIKIIEKKQSSLKMSDIRFEIPIEGYSF